MLMITSTYGQRPQVGSNFTWSSFDAPLTDWLNSQSNTITYKECLQCNTPLLIKAGSASNEKTPRKEKLLRVPVYTCVHMKYFMLLLARKKPLMNRQLLKTNKVQIRQRCELQHILKAIAMADALCVHTLTVTSFAVGAVACGVCCHLCFGVGCS